MTVTRDGMVVDNCAALVAQLAGTVVHRYTATAGSRGTPEDDTIHYWRCLIVLCSGRQTEQTIQGVVAVERKCRNTGRK